MRSHQALPQLAVVGDVEVQQFVDDHIGPDRRLQRQPKAGHPRSKTSGSQAPHLSAQLFYLRLFASLRLSSLDVGMDFSRMTAGPSSDIDQKVRI